MYEEKNNLTFFQVAFVLVAKQTAVLTSKHGVHAPVGFHSWKDVIVI
jgi:hypothetical protein